MSDDIFWDEAVRAKLRRVEQESGGPKWSLVLLPAQGGEPRVVGPSDPPAIYNAGDDAPIAYFRGLLANAYAVTDTADPYEWLLAPKSV